MLAALCSELDFLPLALELAAARLNVLSLEEITNKLSTRFSLLRSRGNNIQTLNGALDWSWEMLSPWDKAVMAQSSIFRGGFNIEAAEAVLNLDAWKESPPVFDILQDLWYNSLLRANKSSDGTVRYIMLESVRQYSQNQLTKSIVSSHAGENTACLDVGKRHATYFSQYGTRGYFSLLDGVSSSRAWSVLFEEMDNLIAGTKYGDAREAALCCLAALKALGMRGPVSLGIELATRVLHYPDLPRLMQKKIKLERSRYLRLSGRIREAREDVVETNFTPKKTQ